MKSKLIIVGDLAYETTVILGNRRTDLGGSGYYASIGAKAVNNEEVVLLASVEKNFDFSTLCELKLSFEGVNIVPHATTAHFVTEFINDSGERNFYADFGAINFPEYDKIKLYLNDPVIYLAGGNPIRQLHWINELEKNNYSGIVASDSFEKYCSEYPKEFRKVIEQSDIVFLNEKEKQLLRYDPETSKKITILKRGAKGADLIDRTGKIATISPTIVKPAVDTNGAGDILASAFLSKIIEGSNYTSALQIAVNLATLSVTKENVLHIL